MISPLLANIYLHPLDCWMRERGYRMVRYADDFVVLCQTASEARAGLAAVRAWVQANALILNPDKTHVVDFHCQLTLLFVSGRQDAVDCAYGAASEEMHS